MSDNKKSTAKHFVVVDIEDFLSENAIEKESIDLTQKRITCLCPYCIENGEPNSKATLYVYPENMSLFCFRCYTYGVDKSLALSKTQLNMVKLKNQVKKNLSQKDDKLVLSGINLDHLPLIRSNEYITYFMQKRSYKYVPKLDQWGFREINFMGQKGIVLPFFYDGLLVDYQIRYLNPTNHRRKYYLSEGDKIPFFINGYDKSR
ncbi:hypothetical protein YerA41_114 [Yersinia phage YerA41]|nr:hypothetical protein YerA41_114 [Yersinia phage YerA41]